LHLDGVGTRRQPKMQIEKSVVNGFQGKRESDPAIALRGRKLRCSRTRDSVRLIYQFAFYLRETGHGAKRHKWFPNPDGRMSARLRRLQFLLEICKLQIVQATVRP
jgi:hypothetical protein